MCVYFFYIIFTQIYFYSYNNTCVYFFYNLYTYLSCMCLFLYNFYTNIYFYSYNNTHAYFFILYADLYLSLKIWKGSYKKGQKNPKRVLYLRKNVVISKGTYISTHILINRQLVRWWLMLNLVWRTTVWSPATATGRGLKPLNVRTDPERD
jgi:hypothetical protein